MTWWQEKPMRLIQTNLREIDLPFDPGEYARLIADMGANVVLFNLGGIVANYPTRLPYHYRNPRLDKDMVEELINQVHALDIRLIGRFDFSKVNQVIGSQNQDWLYRSLEGETVTYNGQMHCCVNGAYQQQHSLAILSEAIDLYPLDGVFFNMIGYQTRDYSGVYYGVCQCENCRVRFKEFCGEPLPAREDRSDPVFQQYLRFCQQTSSELFYKIRDTIKARRPNCAICTYISGGIDVVRSESNSGIRRPQPEFIYDASYNVRRVQCSRPGLPSSNAAVHFIDYPYRHAAVSPALTARRIAQNFIHAGWLDFYVIGHLQQQYDRTCLPEVKRLFHLHRRIDSWLVGLQPVADVCLIEASPTNPGRNPDELKGWISILSEAHILYDVIDESALIESDIANRLANYQVVIVPDIACLSYELTSGLDTYVNNGGRLLLTGLSGSITVDGQPLMSPELKCAGISAFQQHPYIPGAYFEITSADRAFLPGLETVDWIPMDSAWLECSPAKKSLAFLRYIPTGMYGPPEKCYYTETTNHPGIILHQAGKGKCAFLPWQAGSQYWRFPTHAVAGLLRGVLDKILDLNRTVGIDAPESVEISAFRCSKDGSLLLGLVNLSGQNGHAVHNPLPVSDLRFCLPSIQEACRIETMTQGEIPCKQTPGGSLEFSLPRLDLLEFIRVT